MGRSVYTLATMELSQTAYDEIAKKLRDAGYDHVFGIGGDAGLIDMTHIGLTRAPEADLSQMSYAMCEKKARDNYTVTVGFFTLEAAQKFHGECCARSARDATKGERS